MPTINRGLADGPTPAPEVDEQPRPYKEENQQYIDSMERSYAELPSPEKQPLIRKIIEYLETHPFTAKEGEAMYSYQDENGVFETGVISEVDYKQRFYPMPEGDLPLPTPHVYGKVSCTKYLILSHKKKKSIILTRLTYTLL